MLWFVPYMAAVWVSSCFMLCSEVTMSLNCEELKSANLKKKIYFYHACCFFFDLQIFFNIPIWLLLFKGMNKYALPLYLLWILQLGKIMKRCIIHCHLWSIVFGGDSGVSCKARCSYRSPGLGRHEHKEPVYLLTFEIQGKLLCYFFSQLFL